MCDIDHALLGPLRVYYVQQQSLGRTRVHGANVN